MSTSVYAGLVRQTPIVPYPVAAASTLKYGMVVEWNSGTSVAQAFSVNSHVIIGVCTGNADLDILTVPVYVAKGGTVQILCEASIVPIVGALLYFSTTLGSVTNVSSGTAIARAVLPGLNGYVEAVLI